ncbi:MAG: helix-turn-helix domain-containing protein [Cytophagales bacterium]|nr:helix-turn-helix domain-containing protein [Cytophagales bacterium]
MATEIITKEDLREFKTELLGDLQTLIQDNDGGSNRKWLKSSEVRKMLKISAGSLQNLRVNGHLPYTKVQGIIFYEYQDIIDMIDNNKYNNA